MKTSIRSMKTIGAVLAAAFALAAGCDANHVLGSDPSGASGAGAGTTGSAGAGGQAGTSASGQAGAGGVTGAAGAVGGSTGAAGLKAGPLGPSQSWTGYIEQMKFPSGSDQIRLTFASDDKGVAAGTVVFGVGTPPLPATDPNVGYPSGIANNGVGGAPGGGPIEGYSYAFDGGTLDAHRLRFTVNEAQFWSGWCGLQTPPADARTDGSGGCLPNFSGFESTPNGSCFIDEGTPSKSMPIDCGKLMLCMPGGPCACTAAGCAYNQNGSLWTSFDLFLSGDTLSGSTEGISGGNVHFVRD